MADHTPDPTSPASGTAASVAVLGTGIMGAAMARNLCRAGLRVRVWNRTRAKAEPLAAEGAHVADTPDEAVSGAGVVLTILYDGRTTLAAMRAAAPGLSQGMVWMQSATAGVEGLEPLAAFARDQRMSFVDAPVLGTRQPAEAGQLTVLAAGPEEVRGRLTPVLEAISARTLWVGEKPGAASRLKLVVNSWGLAATHGAAEALALADALGVSTADFLAAVAGGPMDMGFLRAKTAILRSGDLDPSFAVDTAEKDARLIMAAGQAAGVRLDVTEAGAERFRRAAAQGHGDQDMIASYFASFD